MGDFFWRDYCNGRHGEDYEKCPGREIAALLKENKRLNEKVQSVEDAKEYFKEVSRIERSAKNDFFDIANKLKDENRRRLDVRESVRWFALKMEEKLKENDHKGGWKDCSAGHLINLLLQEVFELHNAILTKEGPVCIAKEAADVANLAMMIADNARAEIPKPEDR